MHRMNPSLAVLKFGGAALASPERIAAAARLVARAATRYPQLVVVVSAMGKTTDQLLGLIQAVRPHGPCSRETDLVAAAGEQISAGLMSLALQAQGLTARPFLGSEVRILTSAAAGAAEIRRVERARLSEALLRGEIPVVAGFQGVGPDGRVTTLGRGGSDTTAVAVAAALGAAVCEFYKDVDGVYAEDPAASPAAAKHDALSYDEMIALAQGGARVLSSSAVSLAKRHGVNLVVRSAFTDAAGTTVSTH